MDPDEDNFEERARRKILDAKAKARPGEAVDSCRFSICLPVQLFIVELDHGAWTKHNHCQTFKLTAGGDDCPRIDVNKVSPEEFIEKYEKLYKPVVITGVCDNWNASYKWTLDVSVC